MATPLTDSINALTAYANEITGKSDTTLSDAVGSLVEGYGGGSGYTLIRSEEREISTTSTSPVAQPVISAGLSAWTSDKIIYVKIRDKAGKRTGHYLGSDTFIANINPAKGISSTFGTITRNNFFVDDNGALGIQTSVFGDYCANINNIGGLGLNARYHATNTYTIDGTFSIEVYLLDWPNGSPFV